VLDTITDIYRNKIRNAYETLVWSKGGSGTSITQEEYLKVIECLWDREIIPQLVELSKQGKLRDNEGNNLNVVVHKAMDVSYSDVGECESYLKTVKKVASKDSYKNLPEVIKKGFADNIDDDVIFNTDAKSEFYQLLGDGYTKGNIIILPCE
jgi:hypothetical protein